MVELSRIEVVRDPGLTFLRQGRRSPNLLLNLHQHTRIGGAKQDRTADLLRARQALSQLSYSPSLVLRLLSQA